MIRIPEVPGLQGQPVNSPALRIEAAAAPVAALGSLARGIASVGEHFQGVADETQRLENARLASSARQKLAADYADLQAQLDKDPDPAARISKARDFFRQRRDMPDDPSIPPAVRDQIRDHHESFATGAMIDQAAATAKLTHQRAALALENEINAATATGNRQELDRAIATAAEAGVVLPEKAAAIVADFDRSVSATSLDLAIQKDPHLVLEDIERPDFLARMPGLKKDDIPRIQSAARASSQRKRAEELDLIEAALAEEKLNPDDLEGAEYLTPGDVAKIRHAMQKVEAPSAEAHGQAWDLLLANRESFYDPGLKDSDYAAKWNDLRAEVIAKIPAAYRADINSELAARSPANRNTARVKPLKDVDKAEQKTVAVDRIGRARAAGMFGDVSDEAAPAVREKAFRRAEELRLKVSRFIDQHPEAGIDEISEFTDGQISGDRVKTTAADLRQFIPGSGQRLRPAPPMAPLPGMEPGTGGASSALLPPRQQLDTFLDQ